MKFVVEILGGSSFEIEVERTDTLLVVKQKIEKSQRVPVSKQTLIVDGIFILREDLRVRFKIRL
ncbi:putative Ubiquitin domain-containing protein [Arabidopsis thaliana]